MMDGGRTKSEQSKAETNAALAMAKLSKVRRKCNFPRQLHFKDSSAAAPAAHTPTPFIILDNLFPNKLSST